MTIETPRNSFPRALLAISQPHEILCVLAEVMLREGKHLSFACMRYIQLTQECNHVLYISGDVAGWFTAAPPTCPGGNLTISCTVAGDQSGVTLWRVNGSSECVLSHNTAGATATCQSGSALRATSETGFGTNATSFSSTLSGTATPALNGTLVECFGPDLNRTAENMVGNSTLQILGNGIFKHLFLLWKGAVIYIVLYHIESFDHTDQMYISSTAQKALTFTSIIFIISSQFFIFQVLLLPPPSPVLTSLKTSVEL